MKASIKLIILGTTGATALGVVSAVRHFRARKFERNLESVLSDLDADLEEPVIVGEEFVVVTEAGPFDIEMELVPQGGFEPRATK